PWNEVDGIPILACAGWYIYEDYSGAGEALIILEDGRASLQSTGHCSCYGPWEDELESSDFEDYVSLKTRMQENPEYWETVRHLFEYCEANFAQ
ncbi:MAG: hypothetical protein ACRDC4_17550, partial [Plesiomonas sp.]